MLKKYLNKIVKVKIDRPANSKHPKHGFVYPINYGYIENTISGDGEEIDAYILEEKNPVKYFEGKVVAIIHRLNDCEDKLVVAPVNEKTYTKEEIVKATNFQEQFFKSEIIF